MRRSVFVWSGPVFVALGIALTSCNHTVDEIRLTVDEDRAGSLTASGHDKLSQKDMQDWDKSSAKAALEKLSSEIENCGFSTSAYRKADRSYLDVRTKFSNPDELSSKVRCAPTAWEQFDLSISEDKGLLHTVYTTRLVISQPYILARAGSFADGFEDVPREVFLTVPGKIDDAQSSTSIEGASSTVEIENEERVILRLSVAPDREKEWGRRYEAFAARMTAAHGDLKQIDDGIIQREVAKLPQHRVDLAIESSIARYELEDIISFLGILFGSGLAIELARRVFRVRIEPRTSRADEGEN